MFATSTVKPGLTWLPITMNALVAVAFSKLSLPAYDAVTVYLPALRPATVKVA